MNLSLQVRQLVAASILLTLFFGLTGIALDEAFQHSAAAALRLRLETLGYALMGTVQTDAESPQLIVKQLPIPALSQANSGLYASIRVLPGGPVWNSPSALGFDIIYPAIGTLGQWVYDSSNLSSGAELVTATYTALWEATGQRMMFQVAADAEVLATEVGAFRASLWRWLGGLVLVLLLLQTLLLRWSLGPLRRVGDELRQVESGHKSQLDDDYPQELRGLTSSLNSFIHREQRRLQRYRDTLSDLAHSLKTPIAVIRGAMEGRASPDELRSATQEQLDRMNQIVDYQLHRAATSGQVALAAPTVIAPLADKLIRSLQRIHHQRAIQCDVEIPPTLNISGGLELFEKGQEFTGQLVPWRQVNQGHRLFV